MQQPIPFKALIIHSALALVTAMVVLVVFVFPVEYNIDPTGIGRKIGISALYGKNSSKADEPSDSTKITIEPGKWAEYKLNVQQYDKIKYSWKTKEGLPVHVDLHGEPVRSEYYESYAIADVRGMKGQFVAPYSGTHGWYWKNESEKPVEIELEFSGKFTIKGLIE